MHVQYFKVNNPPYMICVAQLSVGRWKCRTCKSKPEN